ncbi:MAG TPA: HU family DNA-binding protein [Ferruginibacter sp.]|nr:HU family DNA-binding protein [Ferruginibacter sp.]
MWFPAILYKKNYDKKNFVAIKNRLYLLQLKNSKKNIMNKAELISKLADDAGITKTQANAALDSFVEAVTKTLKGGGKVTLVGFGTFSVSKRAARNGRNPQTGAVIKIKAKKVAKFKAGKELSAKM